MYGHYLGEIAPGSIFEQRAALRLSRHGWIRTTTHIIDVTRWVFENVEPYVFVSELDHPDYDEGGNQLRKAMMTPPPKFAEGREVKPNGRVSNEAWDILTDIVGGDGRLTTQQLAWAANMPVDMMKDPKVVYTALDKLGLRAFIPIDNWHMVMK